MSTTNECISITKCLKKIKKFYNCLKNNTNNINKSNLNNKTIFIFGTVRIDEFKYDDGSKNRS